MNSPSFVSVTKVEGRVESAVRTAIRRAGGMDSLVGRGDEVYLKPNFVAPRDSSQGVTTDLEVVRAVAEEVHRCGGTPILYETPAIEFDRDRVYSVLGIREFAAKNRIRIMDGPIELMEVRVPGGRILKRVRIPKVLHGAKIINLPKLKTHVSARMTCAIKNFIGLLPYEEKRRIHVLGVHRSVADLAAVFRPIFTVVDAVTCLEGDGPTYGDPLELGLIISGRNPIAVDTVCSQIIGLAPQKIGYLRQIEKLGKIDNIQIVGESLSRVSVPFRIPSKSPLYHLANWMIYTLDIVFSKLFSRPFNQYLYSTGRLGTNPMIDKRKCDQCGDCLSVCPMGDVLDIQKFRVNHKLCLRCLKCFLACPREAIVVKGVSRPKK